MPACPRCGARIHERGRPCPECSSANAWSAYETEPLVIDHAAIEEAEARLVDDSARRSRVGPAVLVLLSPALAALGIWRSAALLRPWEIAPLETLRDGILVASRHAAWFGLGAFLVGLIALLRLRRSRLFLSAPLIAAAALGLVGGCFSGAVGGWFWAHASQGLGGEYTSVPDRGPDAAGPEGAVTRATAVIVAPDGDGDARLASLGTGVIIRSDPDRAWIATSSHVAMPYESASAFRNAADAHPVWVYLSDGRNAKGRVVWVAQPPLDIAVVTVDLPDPPAAIPVRMTADSVEPGAPVFFVPNPLRHGWLVHRGRVMRRVPHDTPAGRFSLVYSDLPVQPGDSGSGQFLADGRLVGLTTWRSEGPGGPVAIGLPSDGLQEMLVILDTADPDRMLPEESRR